MNVVRAREDLERLYKTTRATAQAVFKDCAVYMERYLEAPRHTEVQLVCDDHGQRRLLLRARLLGPATPSEADRGGAVDPPPDEARRDIGERAVAGALASATRAPGTMEFLLDSEGNLSFMEMNTRIQVEHPVAEMITGVDLIQEQIRVAAGEPLSVTQDDLAVRGHAIECRINAEDPDRDFAPAAGPDRHLHRPGGP